MLDSPEEAARLRRFARHLHELYGVPFRLAMLSANGGYSVANNLGASLARGRKLLLLNSDVLPARPGWLSRMTAFYDATPRHRGARRRSCSTRTTRSSTRASLRPQPSPTARSAVGNQHYYKGLHRRFAPANVSRAVPAVTGACLMIDRELLEQPRRAARHLRAGRLRGLRPLPAPGEQGARTGTCPDVELYHLEGQSYPTPERAAASRYNQWLHSDLWRTAISELEDAA